MDFEINPLSKLCFPSCCEVSNYFVTREAKVFLRTTKEGRLIPKGLDLSLDFNMPKYDVN